MAPRKKKLDLGPPQRKIDQFFHRIEKKVKSENSSNNQNNGLTQINLVDRALIAPSPVVNNGFPGSEVELVSSLSSPSSVSSRRSIKSTGKRKRASPRGLTPRSSVKKVNRQSTPRSKDAGRVQSNTIERYLSPRKALTCVKALFPGSSEAKKSPANNFTAIKPRLSASRDLRFELEKVTEEDRGGEGEKLTISHVKPNIVGTNPPPVLSDHHDIVLSVREDDAPGSQTIDEIIIDADDIVEPMDSTSSESSSPPEGLSTNDPSNFVLNLPEEFFEEATVDNVLAESEILEKFKSLTPFKKEEESSFSFDLQDFHRFEVCSVEKPDGLRVMNLKIKHIPTEGTYFCQLSGQWIQSSITQGNIVHIKSDRFEERTFYIDNHQGFITINPDTMVTSTLLSNSVFCLRKAWLGEQFKGWGFGNKYMLVGTIVHQLFQKACTLRINSTSHLEALLASIVCDYNIIMECFVSGISEAHLIAEARAYIPSIVEWMNKYVINGPSCLEDDPVRVQILAVHDIEDNIWCPALGSKGKIDATVEVEIHSNPRKRVVMPLELKTGRSSFSFEHMGQISLYSMMLQNRESNECDNGLLLYLKDQPKMKLNQIKRPVAQAILQKRNDLAHFLTQPQQGPPVKDSVRSCSKCDHLLDCSLMIKSFEPVKLEESRVMREELVPAATAHLTEKDIEFFKHWINLVNLEMLENKKGVNDFAFWSESSETRESKGLGLSNIIIHSLGPESVVFRRNPNYAQALESFTKNCSDMNGERVAISVDEKNVKVPSKVAIFIGFVLKMDSNEITVSLERPLRERYAGLNLRLDVLKYSNTYSANYDNILRLMLNDQNCQKLRQLIIHQNTPKFNDRFSRKVVEVAKEIIRPMNEPQQRAVLRVINTEDYLLIRGTPGSGKTSVIVSIVRVLVALNRSVLITSHTHAAVDNILSKLKEFGVDFVRIGSNYRIHPEVQEFSLSAKTKGIQSYEELKRFYSQINVAAVTCLGVSSDPLFELKKFDYCLVDEASQVLLPTTLGPLFSSVKFILVGDEKQLPPVVQSRTARECGLQKSLFSLLLANESSSLQLTIQYRMNQEILSIASRLFYDNRLECGNQKVAEGTLPGPKDVNTGFHWLNHVLSSELSKSFLFLNTDELSHDDNPYSGVLENDIEVKLVYFLAHQFINVIGLTAQQIGVISPFQRQVSLIKKRLDMSDIYVNSVDQYQGKEKECILISCVKQCHEQPVKVTTEEILSDERRLNVAITRASKKLILIGSRSTLKHYQPFESLFSILRPDQFINIPRNDLPDHLPLI